MNAEHSAVHQSREGEEVEHLCAVPPGIGVAIFPLALIIEAIYLRGHHKFGSSQVCRQR